MWLLEQKNQIVAALQHKIVFFTFSFFSEKESLLFGISFVFLIEGPGLRIAGYHIYISYIYFPPNATA